MRALIAGACLVLTSALAAADEASDSRAPKLPVDGRNGSFTRVIPIETPAFRGIEPDLRLVYDSASGLRNLPAAGAEFGVGWSLQGVSAIQRVSGTPAPAAGQNKRPSGRGAPAYGAAGFAADSFMLDGTELIACTEVPNPAATPSCASAGASATVFTSRVETYLRIRQNASANNWEVTGRDGVRSVYTSREGAAFGQTYRWHLASVTDRRGNRLDYDWSCEAGHCTIASIRAFTVGSGAPASEIVFHTQARPDPITYGDGRQMRAMTRRVTAIQIKNGGMQQAAYKLGYQVSASTGLSRLVSVQRFGTDAVISHGIVTEGSSLPAYVMTYSENGSQSGAPSFQRNSGWSGPSSFEVIGDFNGDGWPSDVFLPQTFFRPQTLSGNAKKTVIRPGLYPSTGRPQILPEHRLDWKKPNDLDKYEFIDGAVVDIDGDSRADVIAPKLEYEYSWDSRNKTFVLTNIRSKGYSGRSISAGGRTDRVFFDLPNSAHVGSRTGKAGDFNGDGQGDFLQSNGWIILSTPGDPTRPVIANWGLASISKFDKKLVGVADVNGDGRADVIAEGSEDRTYRVFLSTGHSFVGQPTFRGGDKRPVIADVNGDGLSDLVFIGPTSKRSPRRVSTHFSNGINYTNSSDESLSYSSIAVRGSPATSSSKSFRAGDFNGDGRTDLVIGSDVLRAIGNSFEASSHGFGQDENVYVVADYNGDGADDLVPESNKLKHRLVWLSRLGQADLLTSFHEPLGGRVSVIYGPSAGTPGSRLPFNSQIVKSLTLDDGRGGVSTLSFAYEGGAWSREERQFLGFRKVTTALPCIAGESACPQQVRTYEQTPGCVGQLSQEQIFDAPGGSLFGTAVEN